MVQDYLRPASLEEALDLKARRLDAAFLAGGTYLLAGDYREKPAAVIDIGPLLPRGIERNGATLAIGAGATFQELVDSRNVPEAIRSAALSMVNRNVRNRATVGGNLGASKSCSSLIPLFLVLGARARLVVPGPEGDARERPTRLADWLEAGAAREGLILGVELELRKGEKVAFGRYARTSCDLSVLTAAAAFRPSASGAMDDLAVAMGGLGPRARRFPELESLFAGKALPAKAEIEAASRGLFEPRSDWRGSAEYKRQRAAVLLADVLHNAEDIA
jgi:putative selenate reductase FAD-binding subunit